MSKKVKTVLISAVSVVVAVAIVIGIVWALGRNGDPVKVVPVSMHSSGYMGNETESGGYVTAEKLQKIYASSTQTVTELFVALGQEVKKGDKLLSYDTTLSDIQLERKQIDVKQAELNLQNAKDELARINAMKPYVPPAPTEPTTEAPTEPLEPVEELPYRIGGDGTEEKPLRYLVAEDFLFDMDFLMKAMGEKKELYVAFEQREANALKGELLQNWGLHLLLDEETDKLHIGGFVPSVPSDDEPEPDPVLPDDDSSGYTAAEIAKMRAEQQVKIRDADLAYRQAQVEYEKMKIEAENGFVYATVDGTVLAVNDPETAAQENLPIVTVSGGGCYYVKATLSEFDLQKYGVGAQVRIQTWGMNGMVETTGVVESVSDTPTSGGSYYGSSNPNASYYSAMIAVSADAELTEGDYVSVYFGGSGDSDAMYLEAMYLRTEGTRAYVYRRGEDGLLKKSYVRTGEQLWGYVRIIDGLTQDDYIAFPYGKNVKEGAKTETDEDGDMNAYPGVY